jgi:hypothetical protein
MSQGCEAAIEQGAKPVQLYVAPGRMQDWPFSPGIHRCQHSLCNVTHSSRTQPHARLLTIKGEKEQKADAAGAVLAAVALESWASYSSAKSQFWNYFDLGVSYAHSHPGLHTSCNNYFPAQFLSQGAPFSAKHDAVLWLEGNCSMQKRKKMVQALRKETAVDSLGSCFGTEGGLRSSIAFRALSLRFPSQATMHQIMPDAVWQVIISM